MNSARLWVVTALLCATAVILHVRGDVDRVPASRPLDQMPMMLDSRLATDMPLDSEVLDVLGKGIFLNRIYKAPDSDRSPGAAAPIGLFIGYFPTQRTGQSIHSPQNCLPGAGWTFISSGVTELNSPSGRKYPVGEYLI